MKRARKILRILLAGFVLLLAAAFLYSLFEEWRGKRAWQNTIDQLEARGIPYEWEEFIPTPIPDDQNLALARVMTGSYRAEGAWTEIGNWESEALIGDQASRDSQQLSELLKAIGDESFGHIDTFLMQTDEVILGEIRTLLAPYSEHLADIRRACAERPDSYLPGDYAFGFDSPIPDFQVIRSATRLLYAESVLAIHEGDADRVLQNCEAMRRVANLNPQVPLLINVMIENVVWRSHITELLTVGLERDIFDRSQLQQTAELSQSVDLVSQLGRALSTEFAGSIDSMMRFTEAPQETLQVFGSDNFGLILGQSSVKMDRLLAKALWRIAPAKGWNLMMLSRYVDFMTPHISPIDTEAGTIRIEGFERMQAEHDVILNESSLFDTFILLVVPAYNKVAEAALDGQRRQDLVYITATLRLSLENGETLPKHLENFPKTLPEDPSTQQHYDYEAADDGFRLSSPGIDGTYGTEDDLVVEYHTVVG